LSRRKYSADAVLLLARLPEPGRVKTRLSPRLSPQGCAAVHGWLLQDALVRLQDLPVARRWLWCGDPAAGQALLHSAARRGWALQRQADGDLGARMYHALRLALQRHERVVLIGSDCPGLDTQRIHQALALLRSYPLVFNPAHDGGYILIGMTRKALGARGLFADMPWGSERVLRESLLRARRAGLPVGLLPPLADIDRPEDLPGSSVPERIWR